MFGHLCQDEAPETEVRSCWSLFLEGAFGIKKRTGKSSQAPPGIQGEFIYFMLGIQWCIQKGVV